MPDLRVPVVTGPAFEVLPGDPGSPVVLHVPHASTVIPDDVRAGILLSDDDLATELLRMTDAHTDTIATSAADQVVAVGGLRPWIFVNRRSRLVVDPERFPDEREVMRSVGMGAVYTRTSHGEVLREPTPVEERELIETYFEPYAAAMTDLVADRLEVVGRCVIVDVHSYPSVALPYEIHPDDRRPALCIGVDEHHTPSALVEAAREAFAPLGGSVVNEPFAGAYVPLRFYGQDERVEAVMLEIRRDLYVSETGNRLKSLTAVADAVALVVSPN